MSFDKKGRRVYESVKNDMDFPVEVWYDAGHRGMMPENTTKDDVEIVQPGATSMLKTFKRMNRLHYVCLRYLNQTTARTQEVFRIKFTPQMDKDTDEMLVSLLLEPADEWEEDVIMRVFVKGPVDRPYQKKVEDETLTFSWPDEFKVAKFRPS